MQKKSRNSLGLWWRFLGVMFLKSNVKLLAMKKSDRFHVTGFGADVRTNINFIFWKKINASRN